MLRDSLGLNGTKFGCGVSVCGACTVLENGNAVRSCQIPARNATRRVVDLSSSLPLYVVAVIVKDGRAAYAADGSRDHKRDLRCNGEARPETTRSRGDLRT